jgi:type IV pilus assembly protein PilC
MGNRAYQIAVEKTRDGVIAGRGLAEPLADTKMFPQEAVQIFRVGEQSGLLTQQLKHAAVFYTGEVDYKLKNLTALIEPIVLLVIGGGTGFVAVALVSAMYGIYSSQSLGG